MPGGVGRNRISVTALFVKACVAVQIGLLGLLVLSCSKKAGSGSVVTEFSTTNQTDSSFQYQLYALNSSTQESAYIGSLQWSGSGLEWPSSLTSYLNAISAGSETVQYYVKAYSPTGTGGNGDVYYESPVTGVGTVFNGPITALWYAMRTSASAQSASINLSPVGWQNLLFEVNASCPDCLTRSGSAALQLIQTNPSLQSQLNQVLATLGDGALDIGSFQSPGLGIGYSSPALVQGTMSTSASQGESMTLRLFYYDPLNLGQRITPASWEMQIGSGSPSSIAPGADLSQVTWIFDSTNTGIETITATQSVRGVTNTASFAFQVAFATFPPVVNIPALQFQANHLKSIDLSPYATDPRGEALTFSLVQAPTGMTLSGTTLEWNPTQEPVSQVGPQSAEVAVSNTDGAVTAAIISITVSADNYPQFASSPTSWSLNEGTTGTLTLSLEDQDSDPIEVTCVSGCTSLLSGSPTGAGWPNLAYPNASIYTAGSGGSETAAVSYMPSYLQEIGSDGTASIILSINYPASDTNLRQVYTPAELPLTLHIHNVADPPLWSTQPTSTANPTENIAMTPVSGGAATIPAFNPPSDATLTYSIDNLSGTPGNASNCAWVTLTPSGAVASNTSASISGTPTYTSAGTCTFNIRATDALGLYADSAPVTITVTPVYQAVSASGSISNQTANEGQPFTLDVSGYFTDTDEAGGNDPMESFTYTCLNCSTLGIPTTGANSMSFNGSVFTWTPSYSVVPSGSSTTFSGVQIQCADRGGYTATQTFNLTVNLQPGPMAVSFANNSLAVTGSGSSYSTSLNAGASGTVTVQIANIPNNAPTYAYTIATSCAPSCSAGIASLSATSGSSPGTQNVTLTLSPTYADGYGGATSPSATRQITVSVTDSGNPSIVGNGILTVAVESEDRPLTSFVMNADAGSGTYDLTVDGSVYSSNPITLSPQGPDTSNDSFAYTFVSPPGFGTFSGSSWTFNPVTAGCAPGTSQVVENIGVLATSSHGETISRNVSVTINNAKVGGGGGCPY